MEEQLELPMGNPYGEQSFGPIVVAKLKAETKEELQGLLSRYLLMYPPAGYATEIIIESELYVELERYSHCD